MMLALSSVVDAFKQMKTNGDELSLDLSDYLP